MSEGFIFYGSFLEGVEQLPEDMQLEALKGIIRYGLGEDPEVSGISAALLSMAKPQIDANRKRRADGAKGGRPSKKVEDSSESENHRLSDAKPVVIETETSGCEDENHRLSDAKPKVKVKEKVKDKVKDIPPISPLTVCGMSADDLETLGVVRKVAEKLSDWITSRLEQGDPITETGLKSLVSIAKDKITKHGADAVAQLITECMASGYKGIVWDRLEKARSGTSKKAWQPEERTSAYGDMDELEKRLLAN
jgi:hypothetical protein